jgi:hypothetical protein
LENVGHENWDPREFPELLLLELESNITIRKVQEEVAAEMRSSSGENRTLQLNMGEGKSSVIVPSLTLALADGSVLVRVVAAKPQARQMFEMLVSKLGGLIDRPVYRMPFSRKVKVGLDEARVAQQIFEDCRKTGGVLLVQPEHVLSFKLMARERIIAGDMDVGRALLRSLAFLDSHARDIVDECDENFSVKFELVYTMGVQQPIDFSPDRWARVHEVLDLVRLCVPQLRDELADAVETNSASPGCFPRTRLLAAHAEEQLTRMVARRICDDGLTGLPITHQPSQVRAAVRRYLTERRLTDAEVEEIEELTAEGGALPNCHHLLHLLRGLLAIGVLGFALGRKRWKVDYGPGLGCTRSST